MIVTAVMRRRMRMRQDSRTKGGLLWWPPGQPPRRLQQQPMLPPPDLASQDLAAAHGHPPFFCLGVDSPGAQKGAIIKVVWVIVYGSRKWANTILIGIMLWVVYFLGQGVASWRIKRRSVISTKNLSKGTDAILEHAMLNHACLYTQLTCLWIKATRECVRVSSRFFHDLCGVVLGGWSRGIKRYFDTLIFVSLAGAEESKWVLQRWEQRGLRSEIFCYDEVRQRNTLCCRYRSCCQCCC